MLQYDLDNILAAITAAKHLAREQKSSFDWQAFNLNVNDYLQNVSQNEWRSTFVPLIEGVMNEQGAQMIASFGLQFDVPNVAAMQWFDEYTLKFAQEINATTKAGVGDLIQLAQYEGWSTTQMQDRLNLMFQQWREGTTNPNEWDWYDERMPQYRLNTIARTETMRSSNYGSFKLMQDWKIEKKEWLATYDKQTRQTHIDAWMQYGGKKNAIPMHEHFVVGGQFLMQPGDPNGGGESINCRCTLIPSVDSSVENIPKDPQADS